MTRSQFYKLMMKRVSEAPISRMTGQRLTAIKKGYARVELKIKEEHLHGGGDVHGGIYGLIADTAGFFAMMSLLTPGDTGATIEYKINLIAPARGKKLIAEGRVLTIGKSHCVCEMRVRGENRDLYATGLGTYRIFRGDRIKW